MESDQQISGFQASRDCSLALLSFQQAGFAPKRIFPRRLKGGWSLLQSSLHSLRISPKCCFPDRTKDCPGNYNDLTPVCITLSEDANSAEWLDIRTDDGAKNVSVCESISGPILAQYIIENRRDSLNLFGLKGRIRCPVSRVQRTF